MRVFAFGRTEILYESIRKLDEEFEVTGIITGRASNEYLKNEDDFNRLASKLECPFIITRDVNTKEILEFATSTKSDVAVSINWMNIVGSEFINIFPLGVINAHFGDLPRFRGNAVTNWAMILGEKFITITLHLMEPDDLDSGDILMKRYYSLSDNSTIADINKFAEQNVPEMFCDVIKGLEKDILKKIPQVQTGKDQFRCYPRLPIDSRINWSKSAREIDLLVRASTHPYSGAYSFLKIKGKVKKVYVWESRIVVEKIKDIGTPGHIIKNDKVTGESWVYTGQGIIALKKVSFPEESDFEPGRVWRSIRMRFGIDVEEEIINLQKSIWNIRS